MVSPRQNPAKLKRAIEGDQGFPNSLKPAKIHFGFDMPSEVETKFKPNSGLLSRISREQ